MTKVGGNAMLMKSTLIAVLFAVGCVPGLANTKGTALRPKAPTVTVPSVALVSAPSNEALARYFCPKVANSLVCRLLGPTPTSQELAFVFDVVMKMTNPNAIPLPAVEAMVAFTAYPERAQSSTNVGAVCVALCPEGEECGAPPQDGCTGGEPGLKSMQDYANAAVGFLASVATGATRASDLRVRTIPAGGSADVRVRLQLNPQMMLKIVRSASQDMLSQIRARQKPKFVVPYSLEGTVWVNVESFGKIAAGFGPHQGVWSLR